MLEVVTEIRMAVTPCPAFWATAEMTGHSQICPPFTSFHIPSTNRQKSTLLKEKNRAFIVLPGEDASHQFRQRRMHRVSLSPRRNICRKDGWIDSMGSLSNSFAERVAFPTVS